METDKQERFFDSLGKEEKFLIAAQTLISRRLDVGRFFDAYEFMRSEKLVARKLSWPQLEVILNGLVKVNVLSFSYGDYNLSPEFFLAGFQFPLLEGKREAMLKAMDKFARKWIPTSVYCDGHFVKNDSMSPFCELYRGRVPDEEYEMTNGYMNRTYFERWTLGSPLFDFDENWLSALPVSSQVSMFVSFYNNSLFAQNHEFVFLTDMVISYFLDEKWLTIPVYQQYAAHFAAEWIVLNGDLQSARRFAEASTSGEGVGILALIEFLTAGAATSIPLFQEGLQALKKQRKKRNLTFQTLADPFYLIALMIEGSPANIAEAGKIVGKPDRLYPRSANFVYLLSFFHDHKINGRVHTRALEDSLASSSCLLEKWIWLMVMNWTGNTSLPEKKMPQIKGLYENLLYFSWNWPAFEVKHLFDKFGIKVSSPKPLPDCLYAVTPMADRIRNQEQWETLIDTIETVMGSHTLENSAKIRYFWAIEEKYPGNFNAILMEQKWLKSERWSTAKEVSIGPFISGKKPFPEAMEKADREIIISSPMADNFFMLDESDNIELIKKLAGRNNVYRIEDNHNPVEIIMAEPQAILKSSSEKLILQLEPDCKGEKTVLVEESKYRLAVYEFNEIQLKLAELLSVQNSFPFKALGRLNHLLSGMNEKIRVKTEVGAGTGDDQFEIMEPNYRLRVALDPVGDSIKIQVRVSPFGDHGLAFVPGKGLSEAFAELNGKKMKVRRDFLKEQEMAFELIAECHSLHGIECNDFCGEILSPDESLQLLLELQQIKDLIIEWPRNYRPKKIVKSGFDNFKFSISSGENWFALDGRLTVDEARVVELQHLLANYDGKSRFMALDEDLVLALTDDLKMRVNEIRALADSSGSDARFSRAALPVLENILEDSQDIVADEGWKNAVRRFRAAGSQKFEIPSTLTAELREYQTEGFVWMSRLAALGLGACLADDMGLGKTIEALALILSRAENGPTLVVAPTSVCSNWFAEARKFAPTLNPVLLAESDRTHVLKKPSHYDLIICSYGIMQNEIDQLQKIDWTTLILDEAQAIKNMNTNRSQAVMKLHGDFRLLLTGTPIENHLGELWNLFRFLNPGLLGSMESFNSKFALPIQNHRNREAQKCLKKLVHPFILRRTKSQVLLDLPEKTEITLEVDLSADERALYEGLRRSAVEKIDSCEPTARPMQILAEIMKLRRLCCNSSLVAPEINIASSKLALVEGILDELLENQHKALVFSQFVDHLAIVRKLLDKKKIGYQYLDGSTPAKNRKQIVADFQAGRGNFFLISLKAGGVGLNLTAADYVIHLDPWWNPAVEDQASDRTHRIGQTRPVTVYRIITRNTIEEKIVNLHHRKRELSDSLLAGSEMTARMSADELLELLKAL